MSMTFGLLFYGIATSQSGKQMPPSSTLSLMQQNERMPGNTDCSVLMSSMRDLCVIAATSFFLPSKTNVNVISPRIWSGGQRLAWFLSRRCLIYHTNNAIVGLFVGGRLPMLRRRHQTLSRVIDPALKLTAAWYRRQRRRHRFASRSVWIRRHELHAGRQVRACVWYAEGLMSWLKCCAATSCCARVALCLCTGFVTGGVVGGGGSVTDRNTLYRIPLM